jgi:hypothetical protein
MSDEVLPNDEPALPEKQSKASYFSKRCTISSDEFYTRLVGMNKPNYAVLQRALVKEGFVISLSNVKRWARKYGWSKMLPRSEIVLASNVETVIRTLKVEASALTDGVFTGVQARMMVRLAEMVQKVEIKTPKDIDEMIVACEKIRGLVHAIRGAQFDAKATAGILTGSPPAVSLGSFKPKVVPINGASQDG